MILRVPSLWNIYLVGCLQRLCENDRWKDGGGEYSGALGEDFIIYINFDIIIMIIPNMLVVIILTMILMIT